MRTLGCISFRDKRVDSTLGTPGSMCGGYRATSIPTAILDWRILMGVSRSTLTASSATRCGRPRCRVAADSRRFGSAVRRSTYHDSGEAWKIQCEGRVVALAHDVDFAPMRFHDGFHNREAQASRDPSNPPRFIASYQHGDRLSPRNAGYKAMADPIDLTLFGERN